MTSTDERLLESILRHFRILASIPHCSKSAAALKEYIVTFAQKRGAEVTEDKAGNVLVSLGSPRLCLQAHYDMVCVGRAPRIELRRNGRWLEARESSLGADNGMAVAMMLRLIEKGAPLEYLFTADEEVGLVGAKALELPLRSRKILNLDTEEEGSVYIGCAGGVDLVGTGPVPEPVADSRPSWRVRVAGLPGGHSGVEIHRKIPNAVKVLVRSLVGCSDPVGIVALKGGERRNSIPVSAEAIVRTHTPPEPGELLGVEALTQEASGPSIKESREWLAWLDDAPHGVVEMDPRLGIPESSLNLAGISIEGSGCRVEYSLRAMSDETLEALAGRIERMLHQRGLHSSREEAYPAWKPETGPWIREVERVMSAFFGRAELKAIHAGLECGVLSRKYPDAALASIGPTIEHPHSVRERVDLESVVRIFRVLEQIVDRT